MAGCAGPPRDVGRAATSPDYPWSGTFACVRFLLKLLSKSYKLQELWLWQESGGAFVNNNNFSF